MTAAFTCFAKKVVREHHIPFEISAEPPQKGGEGSTNEGILSQYTKFSVPIISLAETDFPNVLETTTAREAVKTAWRICKG